MPVANKPILFYALEAIRAAGIHDVGVIVGDTHEEIRAACGDGSQWDCKITYIPQEAPLGLAHAVLIAEDFIGDDSFVMYLGDNLVKDGITPFVDEFRSTHCNAQILLSHVLNPQEFGVAELDPETGRVTNLEEKPQQPRTDLALVGVYIFDSSIFEAVKAIHPSNRGELEITDAIQYLIDHGFFVNSHVIDGWWKDTGRLADMLEANRIILDGVHAQVDGEIDATSEVAGRVQVGTGTRIIASVVRGPAIIGDNCTVENSYIGPYTSVYFGCSIRNSEIEHSIILEHSSIHDIATRIEDSLIGKNVKVGQSTARPAAIRLMLGDNSEVGII